MEPSGRSYLRYTIDARRVEAAVIEAVDAEAPRHHLVGGVARYVGGCGIVDPGKSTGAMACRRS
jgi:hypothetical protein